MTDPSTDRLVRRLAAEGGRVRRIASPERAGLLIVGSTVLVGAVFLGPSAVMRGARLVGGNGGAELVVLVSLVVAAIGGMTASLSEREPGREGHAKLGVAALATGLGLALLAALAAARMEPGSAGSWGDQLRCLVKCIVLALPATTLSLLLLSRAAARRPRLAAISAGAGAAALGAVIVHLACSGAGEPHRLAAQGLAPLVGAVLALPFARWLVRWTTPRRAETC